MTSSFFSPNRLIAAAAMLTAVLSLATPAVASTITFGSYAQGGANPAGFTNSYITYDNTQAGHPQSSLPSTGAASAVTSPLSGPFAGASAVSYDPNSSNSGDNNGLTVYTSTYTGNLAGDIGSISLVADDTVIAYLNGVLIGNTSNLSYNTPATFNIASGAYQNGLNTFTFDVLNGPAGAATSASGGPTGFAFEATAAPASAVTPEPSSLVLLGTGALSVAGMVRRRFKS